MLLRTSKKIYNAEWREVVLLLAGVLHEQGRQKVDAFVGSVLDDLADRAKLADQARAVGLLGRVVNDLEPLNYVPADARYRRRSREASASGKRRISGTISDNFPTGLLFM